MAAIFRKVAWQAGHADRPAAMSRQSKKARLMADLAWLDAETPTPIAHSGIPEP